MGSMRSFAILVFALLVPSAVTANGVGPARSGSQDDGFAPQPESFIGTQASRLVGRVRFAGGEPARAAVVVSSAGGQAVTDGAGGFELVVELPFAASEVGVTAVHSATSPALVASALLPLHARGGTIRTGDLELGTGTGCEPSWLPTFGGFPGMNDWVRTLAVFDDGGGPALYAGGGFTTAGGANARRIAKWDGSSWSALGSGMDQSVNAMAVYDDGSGAGPALYAAGNFMTAGGAAANRIAKWDGASWTPLGSGLNQDVRALTVHDDGGGQALYAAGGFTVAGGVDAERVAKWDGSSWSALGEGLNSIVFCLATHDDGTGGGAALYAGGLFTGSGLTAASHVARWDGSAWLPLGSGTNDIVQALVSHDDGNGQELFAGGTFTQAGGANASHVAKWNGTAWVALGSGTGGQYGDVLALVVHDDGSGGGAELYAAGIFTIAGGVSANRVAKWDGSSWSALGLGMEFTVFALASYTDGSGSGPELAAGGLFRTAGGALADRIASWDGSSWNHLGDGLNGDVRALAAYDDGSGDGPELYAGGEFTMCGDLIVNRVARWDGTSWSSLDSGMNDTVLALAVCDVDGERALYAGGAFTNAGGSPAYCIARWNGTSWSSVGVGLSDTVLTLAAHDDGSGAGAELYVGGWFLEANHVPAPRIAKWDGASWSPVGSGMNDVVQALAVYDDGSGGGPALFAGGAFTNLGNRIAKWNGSSWSALGSGVYGGSSPVVNALAVYAHAGGGAALCVGGRFAAAGGVVADHIARWNGTTWSALGSGVDGTSAEVFALSVYDDRTGGGPELHVGGEFTAAGGAPADRIAKWDGSSWSALESGVEKAIYALAAHDDGAAGTALFAGGAFRASPGGDSSIAKWGGCAAGVGATFCFGDGSGTACPCGNAGGPGRGCANSTGLGALLGGYGTSSVAVDDLRFVAEDLLPNQPAVLFAGLHAVNQGDGIVFGDGLRCAGGEVRRLGVEVPDAAGTAAWGPGLGLGGGWSPGDTRRFQVWYRDPTGGPCLSTFNLSNGCEVLFTR